MLQSIQQTIRRRGLLSRGARVLVAVSGGADSVALAYVLQYLRKPWHLDLTLAHLNHGIRGRAADEDAKFVAELAWRLGLSCVIEKADVPRLARRSGVSLEMAARKARYEFLVRAAREVGADCIATAHTADDQVETVLLRVFRGTGPQGLGGIPYEGRWRGAKVVRPMLDVTHRAAVAFLKRHGLRWREDATNRDLDYLRNRVRHQLLPGLESKINPQVRQAVLRLSELMRDESEWVDALALRLFRRCVDPRHPEILLVNTLRRHPVAVRRRITRLWLGREGVDVERVDFQTMSRLDGLHEDTRGTRAVVLPGGFRVVRRYGWLVAEKNDEPPSAFRVRLKIPGEVVLPEPGVRIVTSWGRGIIRQRGGEIGKWPAEASLNAGAIGAAPLFVRSWRRGDRVKPLGMKGSRKLQDVFVDRKVPRDLRPRVPLIECRGEVVWVPGYHVARGWEVPSGARRALHIRLFAI